MNNNTGKAENLLWNEQARAEKGIAVHWVDRGGDVTYHGPGQLVGYPLIPLTPLRLPPSKMEGGKEQSVDYIGYIRNLEKMLIGVLVDMGLGAGQVKGLSGVWLQADYASRCPRCKPEDRKKPAKIAAIGVKVDAHGITRHGFALNVNPDMDFFEGIIPCGIQDHPVVSMADVMPLPPAMETVKQKVGASFAESFGFAARVDKLTF